MSYLVTADAEVDFSNGEYGNIWVYNILVGIFDTYEEANEARLDLYDTFGGFANIEYIYYNIKEING